MCIQYNIEFWLPVGNDQPDWERKVKRGLAQPGTNPAATRIKFHECRGAFLKQARCDPTLVRQGGCYGGRILDFCYQDEDCLERVVDFQATYNTTRRDAELAEQNRLHPDTQAEVNREWRKAYDEWMSAYEHHRGCPDRRAVSTIFQELKRVRIVTDSSYLDDEDRLGPHPGTAREPIVGINRLHDAPRRRY